MMKKIGEHYHQKNSMKESQLEQIDHIKNQMRVGVITKPEAAYAINRDALVRIKELIQQKNTVDRIYKIASFALTESEHLIEP